MFTVTGPGILAPLKITINVPQPTLKHMKHFGLWVLVWICNVNFFFADDISVDFSDVPLFTAEDKAWQFSRASAWAQKTEQGEDPNSYLNIVCLNPGVFWIICLSVIIFNSLCSPCGVCCNKLNSFPSLSSSMWKQCAKQALKIVSDLRLAASNGYYCHAPSTVIAVGTDFFWMLENICWNW